MHNSSDPITHMYKIVYIHKMYLYMYMYVYM